MENTAGPSAWLISEINQYVIMAFSIETQLSSAVARHLVLAGLSWPIYVNVHSLYF